MSTSAAAARGGLFDRNFFRVGGKVADPAGRGEQRRSSEFIWFLFTQDYRRRVDQKIEQVPQEFFESGRVVVVLVLFGSPGTHDSSCTIDVLVGSALNPYTAQVEYCDLSIVNGCVSLQPSEPLM